MKCLTRYCSLLLCFVLLFLVYCAPVSAESVDIPTYRVKESIYTSTDEIATLEKFVPNNGTVEKLTKTVSITNTPNVDYPYTHSIKITPASGSLIKKGNTAKVTLGNVYYRDVYIINGSQYPSTAFDNIFVEVEYKDGSVTFINDISTNDGSNKTFTFEFEPQGDVVSLTYFIEDSFNTKSSTVNFNVSLGEILGDNSYNLQVEQTSETNGLLGSIIEWLKGIKDGITNGLSNVFNGIQNVFNSILELPSKLWNLIQEGLKSLFVPSDEYFETLSNKWDTLLYDRFGALYESVDFIIFFFEEILDFNGMAMKEYFNLPIVSLESVGIPFEFGGYNVRFIPNGFEFLVDVVKMITSFVVSILFFNALRKRYDEVMGVEE